MGGILGGVWGCEWIRGVIVLPLLQVVVNSILVGQYAIYELKKYEIISKFR